MDRWMSIGGRKGGWMDKEYRRFEGIIRVAKSKLQLLLFKELWIFFSTPTAILKNG